MVNDCVRLLIPVINEVYSRMPVRIFEYATQINLDEGKIMEDILRAAIQNAAILLLRSTNRTPDKMKILMHATAGMFSLKSP